MALERKRKNTKNAEEAKFQARLSRNELMAGPLSSEHSKIIYEEARLAEAIHFITQAQSVRQVARDEDLESAYRHAYTLAEAASDIRRMIEAEMQLRKKDGQS